MIFKAIKKGIKKLARGVKKVVKKIGKGIKSAVKKVGKFMGKIGIVGQIAMSFILPGIGGALMKGIGGFLGKGVATMVGSSNALISGAGKILQAAGNFAKAGHSAFKTVTSGIGSFVKEFTGTALKKIPGMDKVFTSLQDAPDSFFKGKDSAWGRVSDNVMKNGSEVLKNFNKAIGKDIAVTGTGPTTAKAINVADKTIDAKPIVDTVGPDGKSLTPVKEPFYPTPDGTLPASPVSGEKITSLLESQQGLGQSPAPSVLSPDNVVTDGLQSVVGEGVTAKVTEDPSFLSKLGTSTKEAIMSIPDKIVEAPGKFVEGLDKTVQKGLQNKVLVETGLKEEPVYNTVYEGSTVVPDMSSTPFMAQYGSPEINDRAYQMSVDPSGYSMSNPWGSPANTYQQELGARYG